MDIKRLRDILRYDPETGVFTWKEPQSPRLPAGAVAGYFVSRGYRQIQIDKVKHREHRLAWAYVYGEWVDSIDHIDGCVSNNSIENLRPATLSQNQHNRKLGKNNTSGFKGVSFCKRSKKWKGTIRLRGKPIHVGLFETAEAANEAVCKERERLHGEFANHG